MTIDGMGLIYILNLWSIFIDIELILVTFFFVDQFIICFDNSSY